MLSATLVAPANFRPGQTVNLEVRLSIQSGYHANANPASEPYLIPTQVKFSPVAGLKFGRPIYPQGQPKTFSFSPKPLSVYQDEVTIRVPVTVAANVTGSKTLSGSVRYQACNDKSCLPPNEAKFSLQTQIGAGKTTTSGATTSIAPSENGGTEATRLAAQSGVRGLPDIVFFDAQGRERRDLRAGEELTREAMLQKLSALKNGARLNEAAGGARGWLQSLQSAPLWLQLMLAFAGGLLLNLTPCVYPMIPITIGYFGAQSEGRLGKTFGLALLYVLGLALVYSGLGLTAALTGTLFGSLLQSRWVVGGVALILGAFALSMLGLFTLQPPQFLMSRGGAKKGGLGALAMGALLGVVAAPCVGPVVAALLTYVGVRGEPLLGFGLFFALSLGLGLPYLLLGAFSGALKSLPRSGMWLERSKKIFAVPLLLAALYYGYSSLKPVEADSSRAWSPATRQALDEAKRAGRPVVVDFRADWCIPCRKLESEVFSRPDVLQQSQGVTLLRADLTRGG